MSVYRQAELPPAGMNAGSEEVPAPGVQRVPDLLGQAGELLRTGRRVRALAAYRMVLGLDPKRVDVAQRIAWIEREEQASGRVRDFRRTFGLVAFLLALVGSWITVREGRLNQLVAGLPVVRSGESDGVAQRLAAMDFLLARHPLWIGGLALRRERDRLGAQERASVDSQSRRDAALETQRDLQLLAAQAACTRAQFMLEGGLLAEARAEFARALRAAPTDSDLRDRIQEELDAIDKHLQLDPVPPPRTIAPRKPYSAGGR